MASARATVEVRASAARAFEALQDFSSWDEWMPGVSSSKVLGDNRVEWSIATPGGVMQVDLKFDLDDKEIRFVRAGSRDGPFPVLEGRLAVEERDTSTEIVFEMTMETQPPGPPAEIVSMLVEQALGTLSQRLPQQDTFERPEPGLLRVPMSDGVELAVNHYRTRIDRAPAVLLTIPYRKEGFFVGEIARLVTSAGFDFLVADVRGIGGSVATYEGLLSDREIQDGAELIEWIGAQDFNDGRVAMMGASYAGANQILIAAKQPKSLVCIAPWVGPVDTYRDWTHRGGIRSHTSWGAMTYLRSQHEETARRGLEQYYLDLLLDPFDNEGHRARSPEYVFSRVEAPVLCMGGWNDYFLRGTLRTYLGVAGPKRLVIGPWGHGDFTPRHQQELIGWLNYWLGGEGEDPTKGRRVHLFMGGADEWRELEDWPDPSSLRAEWHPQPDRKLRADGSGKVAARVVTNIEAVPMSLNVKSAFVPDPTDSGMSIWGEDQFFDTEPLNEDLVVEGPVSAIVRLTVDDCEDVDVYARVSVVKSEKTRLQLTEGRLRASHRAIDLELSILSPDGVPVVPWHPHDRHDPVTSDEVIELQIEMGAMCHRFAAGERIRLGITIVRSDERVEEGTARIEPETRLLLPVAPA